MRRRLYILSVLFLLQVNAVRRRCVNSGILFPEKVLRAPIVVYGQTLSKKIYRDTDTELLANVTFRVDCVLKGQNTENQIEITEAGIHAGHMSCQWLDPGHTYIVFLEQWGTHTNSYRPVDIQELLVNNNTKELLAKTCHLTRLRPLNSLSDNCPNVSFHGYCPHDNIDVDVIPKARSSNHQNPFVKSSYFDHGDQFYLQSNVTIHRSASLEAPSTRPASNTDHLEAISWLCLPTLLLLLSGREQS